MRELRRSRYALSEIVGTLFLVVIVVAAATAFSIFVATYQAQLEQEQAYTHDRNLELVTVLHVTPVANRTPNSNWETLTFTVASLWIGQTLITGIDVNDLAVRNYTAIGLDLDTGQVQTFAVAQGGQFTVGPHEEFTVTIDTTNSTSSSFYDPTAGVPQDGYVKVDLFTAYDNDFVQAFLPPTAIAIVNTLEVFSNRSFVTVPVLDGSQSIQPGNSTIIAWSWNVTNANTQVSTLVSGEKVVPPGIAPSGVPDTYFANLTVTNNDGLEGTAGTTFLY